MHKPRVVFWLALALLPVAAQAYVGPGAGAGAIAVVLGILSAIFFAFVGIVWYPIKRLLRGFKGAKKKDTGSHSDAGQP